MWLIYRHIHSSKAMSCFCKVELYRYCTFFITPIGTGPLGSMLSNEFHLMEEQKHHTLEIVLAVISHVSLLHINRGKTTHVKLQPVFFLQQGVAKFRTFFTVLHEWQSIATTQINHVCSSLSFYSILVFKKLLSTIILFLLRLFMNKNISSSSSPSECYEDNGENYRGTLSITRSGIPCADWSLHINR